MKPVELEIFLQDGLSPGLKKAGQAVSSFSNDTKRQLKDVAGALTVQRGIVHDLEKQYRELEKSVKKMAPGQAATKASSQLAALKRELEAEKAGLEELTKQQRELKLEAENAGVSLRQQLRSVREEIATLLLAYRSLTDQEKQSAQGKELARHIDELTEKAGELNDAIADTSQAITNAASDSRGFDQLAGGIQLVVDGFGLATAGAQALGLSESDLMEVQTQLQTALVASNALTSMQVNLQKQSALMQGVNVIQTKAAATAETIRTWAVGRGVIATKAATIAQAAFNAVAKANPYVLLAMAVVTVVGALYAFAKGNEAAKKAEEERQAQLERTKEINEGIARSIGESAGSQIAAYNKLQRAWKALGDDMAKRRKFVDENKKAFQELGLSVNSVKDAEEVLVNNTSNVVQSFILRAKAAALDKAVTQAYSTMLERQDLARRNARYTVKSQGDEVSYADAQARGMAGVRAVPHEHTAAQGGGATSHSWTTYTYEVSDAGAYNAASNRLALEARDREIQAATAEADRRVNDLQKEIGATEKALDALKIPQMTGGATPTTSTINTTKEDRLEAARKEAEELQKQQAEERLKQQQEFEYQQWQNRIDLMDEGEAKIIAQMELDHRKEQTLLEEQKKQAIKDEIARQKAIFDAQEDEKAVANKKYAKQVFDPNSEEVQSATKAIAEQYATLENELTQKHEKAAQDRVKTNVAAMNEYLSEYGTYQQKQLAIKQLYADKIKAANNEAERLTLAKERDNKLSEINVNNMLMDIDWSLMFKGVGNVLSDLAKETLDKIEAYMKTPEFKKLDAANKEAYTNARNKLREEVRVTGSGPFNADTWGKISEYTRKYQESVRALRDANQQHTQAVSNLEKANDNLIKAQNKLANATTDAEKTIAQKEVEIARHGVNAAQSNVNTTSQNVTQAQDNASEAQDNLANSANDATAGLDNFQQILGQMTDGSLSGFANGISNLILTIRGGSDGVGQGLEGLGAALGGAGSKILGIVGAILSILDMLADDPEQRIHEITEKLYTAINNLLKQAFTLILSSIVDSVRLISNIGDGILKAFGINVNWNNSNAKEVQETIDKLTERNELLQTAIEDLTDEIKASKGTKSVAVYRDAYNYQLETNANYLGIAQAQAGYHGAHHSWNYYWDGFSQEQIERLSGQIGRSWDGNIWSLSPEEMKMLRANVDMWKQIQDSGAGGYGERLTEKLDDYIDQAGKLEELTNELYEGLTGISFDSMYDSFIDQLMDMEASTEDFADNISEYFMRAMLSNKIGELYADKLEEWWKKFGKAMEDNDLTEEERNALSEEYMKYVEEAMRLRDQLAAATGYGSEDKGSSQSGKAGSFNAMSQDQGTKLEGLFVSVQGHVANIDAIVENVAERMSAAEGYLAQIAENTKSNAASAEDIKELLIKIARDGIRTK